MCDEAKNFFRGFVVCMNIQPISNTNFKGHDARPLRGFLMSSNCEGIADEMFKIGKREGFKIFSPFGENVLSTCQEALPYKTKSAEKLWAQDYWTITKDKIFSLNPDIITDSIKKFFNLRYDLTQKVTRETPEFKRINYDVWSMFADLATKEIKNFHEVFIQKKEELNNRLHKAHISGGNLFIFKDGKEDSIIVGQDELEKFDVDEIQGMYGAKNIIVLPQMDYHLDLFIRPLDNKRVLLADDKLTLEILKQGLNKMQKNDESYGVLDDFIKNFQENIKLNNKPQSEEVEKILTENGFEVIKVPARIYETETRENDLVGLKHFCNYVNANVLINKDGDLVYITNKSNIDEQLGLTPALSEKIGFSFEQCFIDSISKYVKPEHMYFVDGENNFVSEIMLSEYQGGIHCACSEIPQ